MYPLALRQILVKFRDSDWRVNRKALLVSEQTFRFSFFPEASEQSSSFTQKVGYNFNTSSPEKEPLESYH